MRKTFAVGRLTGANAEIRWVGDEPGGSEDADLLRTLLRLTWNHDRPGVALPSNRTVH